LAADISQLSAMAASCPEFRLFTLLAASRRWPVQSRISPVPSGKEGMTFAAVAGNEQILTFLEHELWSILKLPEPAAHQHPSRE
jgi:hypothetical protein